MENDVYINLITGEDIKFQNILIHQPTFKEILEIGIEQYNQIMLPYSLTIDCFKDFAEKENADLFEDILMKDKSSITCIAYSLQLLTKAKDVLLYQDHLELTFEKKMFDKNNNEKIIKSSFDINKDNFNDLSEIILKINANKKVEVEKPPKNMSEKQKDIWYKLQEGRRKRAKKDEVHLFDILNICEFAGKYHIPVSEMMDWTLWRIMNCYKAILNIRTYDDNLKIYLVSGDGKTISGDNHWHKKLMIRE